MKVLQSLQESLSDSVTMINVEMRAHLWIFSWRMTF